jgi:hypothetical protein
MHDRHKLYGFGWYAILILFTSFVFSTNAIKSASEFQFRTYRDGSEALVLGKIFADMEGIPTGRPNLGFIEKSIVTKSADVLATYKRVNYPNAVVPEDLNDQQWRHGISTFDAAFLLPRANVAKLGYATNELAPEQKIRFANGDVRTVTKVTYDERYLQVYYSGEKLESAKIGFPHPIDVLGEQNYVFDAYQSQYGLQGIVFSWIHRNIGFFATFERMQFLAASLCAAVLVLLCREYRIAFSNHFGFVFFISMITSPWIIAVARNLYWVPVLWFLPALTAMWIYRSPENSRVRKLLYFLFFVAIFLKCLTGYEYLSSIVIFSLSIFLIDPFLPTPRYRRSSTIKVVLFLSALSVAGFVIALLMHASIRADSIAEGLRFTLQQDAVKYTSIAANGGNGGAANVPLFDLLKTYIFDWHTPVVFWINHQLVFPALVAFAFLSIVFQYLTSDIARHRDAALIIVMLLAPLSWLILMRGHSVIHVHLNYVLWYFGFIPSLLFVTARGVLLCWHHVRQRSRGQGQLSLNQVDQHP